MPEIHWRWICKGSISFREEIVSKEGQVNWAADVITQVNEIKRQEVLLALAVFRLLKMSSTLDHLWTECVFFGTFDAVRWKWNTIVCKEQLFRDPYYIEVLINPVWFMNRIQCYLWSFRDGNQYDTYQLLKLINYPNITIKRTHVWRYLRVRHTQERVWHSGRQIGRAVYTYDAGLFIQTGAQNATFKTTPALRHYLNGTVRYLHSESTTEQTETTRTAHFNLTKYKFHV